MLNREIICIGEDNNVLIETLNARELALKFSIPVNVIKFKTIITDLEIGNNTSITLFDDIEALVDNNLKSIYNIKKIEQISTSSFRIKSSILTKTSNFLLPCLMLDNFTKEYFLYDTFFENAYINKDNLNQLILIYRFSMSPLFLKFEKNVSNHPLFVKKEDKDDYHIYITFNIPEIYKDVTETFLSGKYSKLPEELKKDILKFYRFSNDGNMYQILYKSEKRRKQLELDFGTSFNPSWELYEIPKKEEEIL